MRLLELSLDRYGPFDGQKLVFDEKARLHVIHGPNEAGKSSALAAIGDLFYGAPRGENFLRPKDMSIGALLHRRDGETLRFSRRKGVKNTLLDARGAALPDDALASFLGGTSREIFSRAFGLNAQDLRAGGAEMLKSGGEIGAALFAASSGLRGLIGMRDQFAEDADKIFGERRAGHRAFYQALDRFNAARKTERDASVSESRLKELEAAIVQAQLEIATQDEANREARREISQWRRLRRSAPILRRLKTLREACADFDDLAATAPEALETLRGLIAARDQARDKVDQARQNRDAAKVEMEAAHPDPNLLCRAGEIEDLLRASGAAAKAAKDQERLEDELGAIRQDLLVKVRTAGFDHFDGLSESAPDAAALLRAERQIARGQELAAQKPLLEKALDTERRRYEEFVAPTSGHRLPAAELADMLAAFGDVEKLADDIADDARDQQDAWRVLDERRSRLTPALPDLDLFARVATPDAAMIEAFATRRKDIDDRMAEAARQKDAAEAEEAAARQKLAEIERAGAVARLADLDDARAHRDWFLARLRDAGDDAAQRLETIDRLAEQIRDADAVADRLFREASHVIVAETARDMIATAQNRQLAAQRQWAEANAAGELFAAQWSGAWRTADIAPAPPQAMKSWRVSADQLLQDRDLRLSEANSLRAAQEKLEQARPGLDRLREICGLNDLPLATGALTRRIEQRIAELAEAEAESREARARIADAPQRIAQAQQALDEFARDHAGWRAEWAAVAASLKIDLEADFAEARQRIAFWRALPGLAEKERAMAARVSGIKRDIDAFKSRLDALLADCARDLPADPLDNAIGQLTARLKATRDEEILRARAEKNFTAGAEQADACEERAALAEQALHDSATRFGAGEAAEAFLARLAARAELVAGLAAAQQELARVADDHDEAELRSALNSFDDETAERRLEAIETEIAARDAAIREIHAECTRKSGELEHLRASGGAEAAIFDRENARDDMTELARRYATLKCAALLVDAGLARQRERRRDPLLARAGALFATLTDDRYSGLDQAFGDDDQLQLRARRANGALLTLSALSEGAQDQLYLALRLAFLEDHAARAESPPFIGDDIFASFDEDRAAAGLRALAAAGAEIQPILFTHHRHIVEITQAAVGAQAQILAIERA